MQVSFTASLIRDQKGEIVGTSGILRDITERKQVEAELAKHRYHLEGKSTHS